MSDSTLRNSTYNQKNGRYVLGGKTETSAQFLEWWDRKDVQPDTSDILYVLEEKYVGRPDLLAFSFYGDPLLWWVICQYNGILDPDAELVTGKALLIPSQSKLNASYTGDPTSLGGATSTRLDR